VAATTGEDGKEDHEMPAICLVTDVGRFFSKKTDAALRIRPSKNRYQK
jgi:hypothetical protein